MSVDPQRFEKGIAVRKSLGMHVTPGPNVDEGFFAFLLPVDLAEAWACTFFRQLLREVPLFKVWQ